MRTLFSINKELIFASNAIGKWHARSVFFVFLQSNNESLSRLSECIYDQSAKTIFVELIVPKMISTSIEWSHSLNMIRIRRFPVVHFCFYVPNNIRKGWKKLLFNRTIFRSCTPLSIKIIFFSAAKLCPDKDIRHFYAQIIVWHANYSPSRQICT